MKWSRISNIPKGTPIINTSYNSESPTEHLEAVTITCILLSESKVFPIWTKSDTLDGSVKTFTIENVAEVQVYDVDFPIC